MPFSFIMLVLFAFSAQVASRQKNVDPNTMTDNTSKGTSSKKIPYKDDKR